MASINLSSFAGAGAQFFDNNGTPLVGGLLYVYTAGTTTPATTYTTPSGTVSNTNPIVLDAGGRTPYEVWVNGGVLYKFVLKTSAGVTIGTYDSIPAIDDPTAFNNIITVTGTNTLIGTSTPANTAYARGMTLSFVVVNTNTGAVTIDVDGLGAKEITFSGSTPLIAGQMTAGALVTIEYDGTRFQLMNSSGALAITASSINGGQIAGFRNRIINGAMTINQRGTGAQVPLAAGVYLADRWVYNANKSTTFNAVLDTVSPPNGFTSYLSYTSTGTYSVASGDYQCCSQYVEGLNVYDLGWGASNASSVTVSFWVKSSLTGTFGGSVQNASVNRSYAFTYTITAANTWQYVSVSISGDTSGTWAKDTTTGLRLNFSLGSGTTRSTTAGAWVAGDFNSATGAVNVSGTNGATFYITGVQLEKGVTATPFEQRLYGTELALCQRYFQLAPQMMGVAITTTSSDQVVAFPVQMRSSPTFVQLSTGVNLRVNGSTSNIGVTLSAVSTTPNSSVVQLTRTTGTWTAGNVVAVSEQSTCSFSSEL